MGGMSRHRMRIILFRRLRNGGTTQLGSWTSGFLSKEWEDIKDKHECMLGWLELQAYGQVVLSTKDEWEEKYRDILNPPITKSE